MLVLTSTTILQHIHIHSHQRNNTGVLISLVNTQISSILFLQLANFFILSALPLSSDFVKPASSYDAAHQKVYEYLQAVDK